MWALISGLHVFEQFVTAVERAAGRLAGTAREKQTDQGQPTTGQAASEAIGGEKLFHRFHPYSAERFVAGSTGSRVGSVAARAIID